MAGGSLHDFFSEDLQNGFCLTFRKQAFQKLLKPFGRFLAGGAFQKLNRKEGFPLNVAFGNRIDGDNLLGRMSGIVKRMREETFRKRGEDMLEFLGRNELLRS